MIKQTIDCVMREGAARRLHEKDSVFANRLAQDRLETTKSLSNEVVRLRDAIEQEKDTVTELREEIATHEVEKIDLTRDRDEKNEQINVSMLLIFVGTLYHNIDLQRNNRFSEISTQDHKQGTSRHNRAKKRRQSISMALVDGSAHTRDAVPSHPTFFHCAKYTDVRKCTFPVRQYR